MSLVAVALGSGAAGALNMWYEADLDSLMSRTCLRPIPTGKLTKKQALSFWNFVITNLCISGFALCIFKFNCQLHHSLAFTILFYVFIYTIWLKEKNFRKTLL